MVMYIDVSVDPEWNGLGFRGLWPRNQRVGGAHRRARWTWWSNGRHQGKTRGSCDTWGMRFPTIAQIRAPRFGDVCQRQ